jgi:hypothetical protein
MRPARFAVSALLCALVLPVLPAHAGWVPAVELLPSDIAAGTLSVAAGPDGTAVAAWVRAGQIEAALKPAGAPFGSPVGLGPAAGGRPSTAVADDGQALVAWTDGDDVRAALRSAGAPGFSGATVAEDATGATDAAAGFTLAGRALIAFTSPAERGLVTHPAGGAWSPAWTTAGPTSYSDVEVAPTAGADGAWTAWADKVGAQQRVSVRRWTAATGPETTGEVAGIPADSMLPPFLTSYSAGTLRMASGDGTDLTWVETRSELFPVPSSQTTLRGASATGASFGTPAALASGSNNVSFGSSFGLIGGPVVPLTGGGALSLWASSSTFTPTPTQNRIDAASRAAGATGFGAPAGFAGPTTDGFGDVAGAALPAGRVLVVRPRAGALDASVRTVGGTEESGSLVALAAPAAVVSATEAAGDGAGGAAAVWTAGPSSSLSAALFDETGPELGAISVPAAPVAGAAGGYTIAATDRWSGVGSIAWDFGDGTPAVTGPGPLHAYAAPGTYTITVTATDTAGNPRTATRQVAVAAAPPGGGADAAPALAGARLSPARIARPRSRSRTTKATGLSFRLSKAATVTATFTRAVRGWRSRSRCVAERPRTRTPRRCTRTVTAATLRLAGVAGDNRARLTARVGSRTLTPGTYRLTLVARDAAGRSSAPARLTLVVVR